MSATSPGSAPLAPPLPRLSAVKPLASWRITRTADGTTAVTVRGELDLATVPDLAALLDALTREPRPDLLVDLSEVVFADCTLLGVLCRTRNRVRALDGRLRLVAGRPFRWLLRRTGLAGAFEILPCPPRRPAAAGAAPAAAGQDLD